MLPVKAIIFDMDGVIIDSEKYWKQAEYEVFTSLGVNVTDHYTEITKSMTTREVTQFWYSRYPWKRQSTEEAEQMVIAKVIHLIETESCAINGIKPFIEKLKKQHIKIGLATNSPYPIIPVVLNKLNIYHLFDFIQSAESEENGKPDPAIYFSVARGLNTKPENCIAIEDSFSGMLAAKNAGMTVIAFTNGNKDIHFDIADYKMVGFDNIETENLILFQRS